MGADGSGDSLKNRTRGGVTAAAPWLAAVGLVVVTVLTATSIIALVAYRRAAGTAGASAPRLSTPNPLPTSSPLYLPGSAQLSAPSHGVVWVLVDSQKLFVSSDGGEHWVTRSLPADPGVRPEVSFISDGEGWLLAPGSPTTECQEAPAAIWHTTDGGLTWQKLAGKGLAAAQCKEAIYFADASHGYVNAWDDLHRPTVYATADGGTTWRGATLPDGPLFVTQPGGFTQRVRSIRTFGSTTYLVASGTQPAGTILAAVYVSNDGGATWTWRQKLISPEMAMVTEQRWLQYAPGPGMLESVNGGQQFHPYGTDFVVLSPVLGGTVMVFADAGVGYATGRGELERTIDGGAHWTVIPTPGIDSPTRPPATASPAVRSNAPPTEA